MRLLRALPSFEMHKLFVWCFLLGSAFYTLAQSTHKSCGISEYYDGYPITTPVVSHQNLESRSPIVLSIVIHIVWNKTQENISDQQILAQIDRLNQDFTDPYLDKQNVPKEFRSSIANPQIRFCLASKDPLGKNHSGITRTQTNIPFIGSKKDVDNKYLIHYSNKGGEDQWDPSRYVNIWVGRLENIFGRSTIGGHVNIIAEDGIVIDPDYFNSDPKEHKYGRTLVHEMGHYLGLLHTWGMNIGDCTEEDGLADTPLQEGPYYDCPTYPQKSCNTSNMFMNYMDYVDDICTHFFTKDQVNVMTNTLNTSRKSLQSSAIPCLNNPKPIKIDSISIKILPVQGVIQFLSPTLPDQDIYFTSFNLLGQKVGEENLHITQGGEIFIKDWPQGIYFLYFRYNKEYRTLKFFKP